MINRSGILTGFIKLNNYLKSYTRCLKMRLQQFWFSLKIGWLKCFIKKQSDLKLGNFTFYCNKLKKLIVIRLFFSFLIYLQAKNDFCVCLKSIPIAAEGVCAFFFLFFIPVHWLYTFYWLFSYLCNQRAVHLYYINHH